MIEAPTKTLLSSVDPTPVEVVNPNSESSVFLLCEHAGQAIPAGLGDLGVSETVLFSHRGWDIGAEALARALAARLAAPLVVQRYSRLVFDCNRPPNSPLAISMESDGVPIPGNQNKSIAEQQARVDEIFVPMKTAISALLTPDRKFAFSIHSFTPKMNGQDRPWHAGFLSRTDLKTANALRDHIAHQRLDLTLAINEPYQIETDGDWFIPAQAEPRGLMHSLIEIRNDQLLDAAGITLWADLLAGAIQSLTEAT